MMVAYSGLKLLVHPISAGLLRPETCAILINHAHLKWLVVAASTRRSGSKIVPTVETQGVMSTMHFSYRNVRDSEFQLKWKLRI